ncbi:MAG: A/G-specific adenine glycosylase [Ornithinimicrobium sp.]
MSGPETLHEPVLGWYAEHARDLPWRAAQASPWSVLVSEVMLQQTPVARVEPVWRRWMARWPDPASLACDAPGEAVRAWERLGYPRRAVRLHACARAITDEHGGQVPRDQPTLLTLPGVGTYTAAAVAAFAFGDRATVVDTNVRRVLARSLNAQALPAPSLTRAETALATRALPIDDGDSVRWNVAVMELGALICTARAPVCDSCPINDRCAWLLAGRPAYTGPARRGQTWHGTDRQCRGALLQRLREHEDWLPATAFVPVWPQDDAQRERCLSALVRDGLIQQHEIARSSAGLERAIWYGFAPA